MSLSVVLLETALPLPYTCVPLSSSSVIWYRPDGCTCMISLAAKVTTGPVKNNGSLPPRFMTK